MSARTALWVPAATLAAALVAIPLGVAAGSPITAGPPVTFPDATGDSGIAPDLTGVVISNDANGQLDIRIDIPGQPELAGNALLFLVMNTDINLVTGAPNTFGGDYYFVLDGFDRTFGLYRWDGSQWQPQDTAAQVSYSGGAHISVNRSELGSTDEFGFYAKSFVDGSGPESGRVDFVPDSSTETYMFPLPIPEEPAVQLKSVAVVPSGPPRAGGRFTISVTAVLVVDGRKVAVAPSKLICTMTVGGRRVAARIGSVGQLAKTCSAVIPKDARGKLVVVKLTGNVVVSGEGSTADRTMPFAKTVTKRVR
jgi:hypothetical protein